MTHSWKLPTPGDIVWCCFPFLPDLQPGPKPRPALVIQIDTRYDGHVVTVVYGTSQNVSRLRSGQMAITQHQHSAAYALAGLSYDTKFDFKRLMLLPWSERYFKVPPRSPYGQSPKLGTLHPSLMHAAEMAFRSTKAKLTR
jgi:hypothetical protein